MAHFIGYLQGSRGEASRLGTKNTGIDARAQGWEIGGKIIMECNKDGEDIVTIYVTRGSNNRGNSLNLGSFKIVNNEIVKIE